MHGSFFRFFHVELGYREAAQEVKEDFEAPPKVPIFDGTWGGWIKSRTLKLAFGIGGIWGRNPANQLIGIGYSIFP